MLVMGNKKIYIIRAKTIYLKVFHHSNKGYMIIMG